MFPSGEHSGHGAWICSPDEHSGHGAWICSSGEHSVHRRYAHHINKKYHINHGRAQSITHERFHYPEPLIITVAKENDGILNVTLYLLFYVGIELWFL